MAMSQEWRPTVIRHKEVISLAAVPAKVSLVAMLETMALAISDLDTDATIIKKLKAKYQDDYFTVRDLAHDFGFAKVQYERVTRAFVGKYADEVIRDKAPRHGAPDRWKFKNTGGLAGKVKKKGE